MSTVTLRYASIGLRAFRARVAPGSALIYLGVTAAWVYVVVNTPRYWQQPWTGGWVLLAAVGLHFFVGLAIGRPRGLVLPMASSLLAMPAGYANGEHAGEFDLFPVLPIWESMLLGQVIFLPVMALGVTLAIWIRWSRASARPVRPRAVAESHG
jgi:hypothetical protein